MFLRGELVERVDRLAVGDRQEREVHLLGVSVIPGIRGLDGGTPGVSPTWRGITTRRRPCVKGFHRSRPDDIIRIASPEPRTRARKSV